MELKKNWNSNGNIARGDSRQLRGFCLGQTYSTTIVVPVHRYNNNNNSTLLELEKNLKVCAFCS